MVPGVPAPTTSNTSQRPASWSPGTRLSTLNAPGLVGVKVNVAELPGGSPTVGSGVEAPGKAGVVSPRLATAHEIGRVNRLSQVTATRQPAGISKMTCPLA